MTKQRENSKKEPERDAIVTADRRALRENPRSQRPWRTAVPPKKKDR